MFLSKEEVQHIAQLARLELTDKEIVLYQQQLSAILEYIKMLGEVVTENIEPTSQVTGLQNVVRKDFERSCLSTQEALANAPEQEKSMFKVKAIID